MILSKYYELKTEIQTLFDYHVKVSEQFSGWKNPFVSFLRYRKDQHKNGQCNQSVNENGLNH